jgi:hypothetical protein
MSIAIVALWLVLVGWVAYLAYLSMISGHKIGAVMFFGLALLLSCGIKVDR